MDHDGGADARPRRGRRCTSTAKAQVRDYSGGADARPRRRCRWITTTVQIHGEDADARSWRARRYTATADAQMDHDDRTNARRGRRYTIATGAQIQESGLIPDYRWQHPPSGPRSDRWMARPALSSVRFLRRRSRSLCKTGSRVSVSHDSRRDLPPTDVYRSAPLRRDRFPVKLCQII